MFEILAKIFKFFSVPNNAGLCLAKRLKKCSNPLVLILEDNLRGEDFCTEKLANGNWLISVSNTYADCLELIDYTAYYFDDVILDGAITVTYPSAISALIMVGESIVVNEAFAKFKDSYEPLRSTAESVLQKTIPGSLDPLSRRANLLMYP